MKRPLLHLRLLLAMAFIIAAGLAPRSGNASIVVDPALTVALSTAAPGDHLGLILTYDHKPTAADVTALQPLALKIAGFHRLPMLAALTTPTQIEGLKSLSGLKSIYLNKPLQYFLHESVRTIRAPSVWRDFGVTGKGIGVAILDTGVDATHADLTLGRTTAQNAKIFGLQYAAGQDLELLGLPTHVEENLPTSDLTSGHGTHVAGIVAASGGASNGYYKGVAPGAHLVGVGVGDALDIFTALAGFDYILTKKAEHNIRVVNCSWGDIVPGFDPNHPVNVTTRRARDAGITVVFAAGNSGAKTNSLNTYSVAPWVIGVAAGEKMDPANPSVRKVAFFSSRGIPGDELYHPTLTAPGYLIVSDRTATGTYVNGGSSATDAAFIPPEHLPFYTTANGSSMAAPHVAGVIALMLQANPKLTPGIIKRILVNTATPMPSYQEWQAGAGYLDARAAVVTARSITSLSGYRDPVREPTVNVTRQISGTLTSTILTPSVVTHTLAVKRNTRSLEVTIDWDLVDEGVPLPVADPSYINDLALRLYNPKGQLVATSDAVQSVYNYANETVHVDSPAPGTWRIEVSGIVSAGTPYTGASNAVVAMP